MKRIGLALSGGGFRAILWTRTDCESVGVPFRLPSPFTCLVDKIAAWVVPINEEPGKPKPDAKRLNGLVQKLSQQKGDDPGGEVEQEDRGDQCHHREIG
jgi:hypothetical protein